MTLAPYIMFNGNCEEALNFYAKALNGEIKELHHFEGSPVENESADAQKVMHAIFTAGNFQLMAADGNENEAVGGMVHLSLNFTDAQQQVKVFDALSDGARVTMPLQHTFWGATFGMLTDKFGVNWMFNHDKEQG
jgi:PhnB protein